MSDYEQDPRRLSAFLRAVQSEKSIRISIVVLWRVFRRHFPAVLEGFEERTLLLALLQEAELRSLIALPPRTGKLWDQALTPSLPLSVKNLTVIQQPVVQRWKSFPWHPQLAWVAEIRNLLPEQEAFLYRVQRGLVDGIFQKKVPLKYRSLQLTGHEKRLRELAKSQLFVPGRLSLSFLGCVPEILPLTLECVGEGDCALIVENMGTFHTAYMVLKQLSVSPYGWLGYGSGNSLTQSIQYLRYHATEIRRLEYLGDLDRAGLQIACTVIANAQKEGLPVPLPARGLHQAMLDSVAQLGYPDGIVYHPAEKRIDAEDWQLVSWLPASVQGQVVSLLQSGRRVPEEVLGPDELMATWKR